MILIPKHAPKGPLALVCGMITLGLLGCTTSSSTQPESESRQLLATTSIWADITSSVVCGEVVPSLIPIGSDPHTWEPSIATRADIDSARTIISNGLGLEHGLVDLLDIASEHNIAVLEMSDGVDLLTLEGSNADNQTDDRSTYDPHIWLDPQRVIDVVPVIADAAVAAGFDRPTITPCVEAYVESLLELDDAIGEMFSSLNDGQRAIVTNHDSLGYFADRYGLTIIGTVLPGSDTSAQANAANLADLATLISNTGVTTIFTDVESTDIDARALADRLGIDVVPLLTSSLTSGVDTGRSYLALMENNANIISDALKEQAITQ